MYDHNQVSMTGRLTRDAELRYTNSGKSIIEFSVANQPGDKDKPTSFFDCTLWDRERLHQQLKKGDKVFIVGTIAKERWDGKDGVKHERVRITVREVQFFNWHKEEGAPASTGGSGQAQPSQPASAEKYPDELNIPQEFLDKPSDNDEDENPF